MTRKLLIGGLSRCEGWEVLNANPDVEADHFGNAGDLSMFDDDTFAQLYASHVLEHFDYKDELLATLVEWNRVLVPGGELLVSVPDLDVLAGLLMQKDRLSTEERYVVMQMIFGGHQDEYDYHMVGLNYEFLAYFLERAGYVNLRRVRSLGLFDDTSEVVFAGFPISLNMVAEKPKA